MSPLLFPIEDIAAHHVPGHPIGKANGEDEVEIVELEGALNFARAPSI